MRLRLTPFLLASAIAATAFPATAQEANPIVVRQNIMKSVGSAAGVGSGLLRKQIPFDEKSAGLVLATFSSAGHTFGDYFPDDSKEGNKTEAAPKIWEDKAGFDAEVKKFRDLADAAAGSKPSDLASFQKAFVGIAASCKSCHEGYRVSIN